MPFVAHSIVGTVDIDGKPTVETFKGVAGESGKMKQAVENNAKEAAETMASTFKGKLGELKAEFGKSSLLGQGIKLAAGGGAIAGLGLASAKLHELGGDILDLSEHWDEYSKDQDKGTEKLIGLIPIAGNVVIAMQDIATAFTGQASAVAQATARIQKYHEELAQAAKVKAGTNEAIRGINAAAAKSVVDLAIDQTPAGAGRDKMEARANAINEQIALAEKAKAAIADLGIDDVQKKIDAETAKGPGNRDGNAIGNWTKQLDELKKEKADIESALKAATDASENVANQKIANISADTAKAAAEKAAEQRAQARREIDDLKKEADQAGMTDSQKKLDDLRRSGKYTPQQINDAAGALATTDQQKRIDDMKDAAKSLRESLESPAEKLQETIAKYKEMLKDKLISQEDYDRATLKASQDALAPTISSDKSAALVRSGSAESQAAAFGSKYDKNSVMETLAKQQLAALQTIAGHAETLAGHTTEEPDTVNDMAGVPA